MYVKQKKAPKKKDKTKLQTYTEEPLSAVENEVGLKKNKKKLPPKSK